MLRRMKVSGSGGPLAPSSTRRSQPAAAGGFPLSGAASAGATAAPTRAASVSSLASLDALLALQDVEGPLERKRRAVGRAGRILDVLDDVKLSLLDDGSAEGSLNQLVGAVRAERAKTHDDRLEGVLDEIETRAAVELAKWEMARAA